MGAVNRESLFFVLVAEPEDTVCTIDLKDVFSDREVVGCFDYSDLHL